MKIIMPGETEVRSRQEDLAARVAPHLPVSTCACLCFEPTPKLCRRFISESSEARKLANFGSLKISSSGFPWFLT